jgi:hypothetical protein
MDERYWLGPPKTEVPWILSGEDGRHQVVQWINCDFDARDVLTVCRRWDKPTHVQEVTLADWEQVKKGDPVSAVIARLCAPESITKTRAKQMYSYSVRMPPDSLQERCGGTLVVAKGRVLKIRLGCL